MPWERGWSLVVLAVGVCLAAGLYRLGKLAWRCLSGDQVSHLPLVSLGILLNSLVIQLVGMVHHLDHKFWLVYGIGLGGLSLFELFSWTTTIHQWSGFRSKAWSARVWALPLLFMALCCLSCAIVPSTKIDEIYYHMLLPQRMAMDHGLNFYLMPWESAVLPQMVFQMGMAPLHAMNLMDAGNVVSLFVWGLFCADVFQLLRRSGFSMRYAGLVLLMMMAGTYGTVFYATSGAHAWGDSCLALAIFRLFLIVYQRSVSKHAELIHCDHTNLLLQQSVLCLGGSACKITNLPLSVITFGWTFWSLYSGDGDRRQLQSDLFRSLLLSGLLWLPILIWTSLKSGSPFGPAFGNFFQDSVYGGDNPMVIFQHSVVGSDWWSYQKYSILHFNVCVWLATFGIILIGWWLGPGGRVLAALAGVQLLIIHLLLQPDYRFFGGIQYACLLGAVVLVYSSQTTRFWEDNARVLSVSVLVLLLPWLLMVGYYASPTLPCLLGVESRSDYLRARVALTDDARNLQRMLPETAVLVSRVSRLPSVYMGRPVIYDDRDLGQYKRPGDSFSFYLVSTHPHSDLQLVYENPQAILTTFRWPGTVPIRGWMGVYKFGQ